MNFTNASYLCAAHLARQWPTDVGAEAAFAGRSNVGKSSAINAITRQKNLAHTGKTPGRTRQIVFFQVAAEYRLVDLPGYGYAKAARGLREHWRKIIAEYLRARASLRALIIPMDIRRPLTELDQTMLRRCAEINLPAHILLTKADKLSRARGLQTLARVQAELQTAPQVSVQLFSATRGHGVNAAAQTLLEFLQTAPRPS